MKFDIGVGLENAIGNVAICACIALVTYFVIVVWFAGIVESDRAVELQKAESCYTEYQWSEISKVNVVKVSYCGDNNE